MASKDSTAIKDDVVETVGDIGSELRSLRGDVAMLAQQVTSLLAATGDETLRDAKKRARTAKKQFDGMVSDATDSVQEASETLTESLGDAVNERPIAALAIAVGVGIVLGAAWRR